MITSSDTGLGLPTGGVSRAYNTPAGLDATSHQLLEMRARKSTTLFVTTHLQMAAKGSPATSLSEHFPNAVTTTASSRRVPAHATNISTTPQRRQAFEASSAARRESPPRPAIWTRQPQPHRTRHLEARRRCSLPLPSPLFPPRPAAPPHPSSPLLLRLAVGLLLY